MMASTIRHAAAGLRCPACKTVGGSNKHHGPLPGQVEHTDGSGPVLVQPIPVFNNTAEAGNSYSRYAGLYICSACGVREAVEGFFWRAWCPPDKIDKHHQQ